MLRKTVTDIKAYFTPNEINELKKFVADNLNYKEKDKLSAVNERLLLLSKRNWS